MTDSATAVAAAPFVAALQPYLTAAVTAIVGATVTLAAAAFRKWTGVEVDAANLAVIKGAAETEAGKAVAAAADNLAKAKIDIRSPIVATAVNSMAERVADEIHATGLTPDDLAHMVAGEIGKLQAHMTSVGPAASTA